MSSYKDNKGFEHQRLVLVDTSGREREPSLGVSLAQEEWLATEMNEVLNNIQLQAIRTRLSSQSIASGSV